MQAGQVAGGQEGRGRERHPTLSSVKEDQDDSQDDTLGIRMTEEEEERGMESRSKEARAEHLNPSSVISLNEDQDDAWDQDVSGDQDDRGPGLESRSPRMLPFSFSSVVHLRKALLVVECSGKGER